MVTFQCGPGFRRRVRICILVLTKNANYFEYNEGNDDQDSKRNCEDVFKDLKCYLLCPSCGIS